MKLEDLKIFLATVRTGSFTRAANKLLLTKQHVSRRVEALEQELGVALFTRNSRSLRITDMGNEFQHHASRILDAVDFAAHAMSERCDKLQGTLKISTPLSFGVRYLSPLLAAFVHRHPEVQLQLEASDLYADLTNDDFDVAIRIGRLPDSSLIARRLGEMPVVTCCSGDYIRRRGIPQTPAQLAGHDCLPHGREARTGWTFCVDGESATVMVSGPMRANNGEFIVKAAKAGLGIACLPYFLVQDAIQAGRLVPILEAYGPAPLPLSIVYPQHRHGSSLIRAFIDFARANLSEISMAEALNAGRAELQAG